MKTIVLICAVSAGILFSCAATPPVRETPPYGPQSAVVSTPVASAPARAAPVPESPPPETVPHAPPQETVPREVTPEVTPPQVSAAPRQPVSEISPAAFPPLRQDRPPVPEYIMGKGSVPPLGMTAFLLESNPGMERKFIENLANIYTEESSIEGVNTDVAFAQMCLETGFLRYGGLVTEDMNNFCGLGAIGPDQRGLSFPNPRMGVRAHIQHLKAYATEEPLKQVLVDPRFHYVRRGSSPAINGLAGAWATDRAYAEKIKSILDRLYSFYYKL